jgi:hypothetical protein
MQASELMTVVRSDYLDDTRGELLWDEASLLRKLTEAQRQACNRADLIYDDSSTLAKIKLVDGKSSYTFSSKITVLERFIWNGVTLEKKSKDTLDREATTWRTDTGLTNKTAYVLVQGRNIRITPTPNAADIALSPYLYLECYRLPLNDISGGDQCFEIPDEFVPNLKYWVLHEAYKKQDADMYNQERSDYFLKRFDDAFGNPVPANVRIHQFEAPRGLQVIPHARKNKVVTEDW